MQARDLVKARYTTSYDDHRKPEVLLALSVDYVIIHSEAKSATILQDRLERAILRKVENGTFKLREIGQNRDWTLTNIVDGTVGPFSIACYFDEKIGGAETRQMFDKVFFKIKDHIFFHGGNFYSVGGAVPIDVKPGDSITHPKRYICRLVNFPFSHIDLVDAETKHRLNRHRGIAVGDIHGLGADGFHLTLYSDELSDIALQLTAATYLLYTTR